MSSVAAPEYKLSSLADLASELGRIGLAELDFACAQAERIDADPSDSIHLCRKSIKRLRALVRLARRSGDDDWEALDRALSQAGRQLAVARDSDVLQRTAAHLYEAALPLAATAPHVPDSKPDQRAIAAVVTRLAAIRPLLAAFMAGRRTSLDTVERRIGRGFRMARKRMHRFEAHGRPDDGHHWRKAVQRLGNQLRLVVEFMPAGAENQLAEFDELARNLGDYQDLAVFRAALESGQIQCQRASKAKLDHEAKARQRERETAALKVGKRLFRRSGRTRAPRLAASGARSVASANGP